jgi:hypothetical protein
MTPQHSGAVPRPSPGRIPRYVRNLNALAERHGISVNVTNEPYDNDPEIRLWSEWSGTCEQFLATGLFVPSQARLLLSLTAFHSHSDSTLTVPTSPTPPCLLAGKLTVGGNQVLWKIDSGPAQYTVSERCRVEIVTYADIVAYHGTTEDLVIARVCDRKCLPVGKRPFRSGGSYYSAAGPNWSARRPRRPPQTPPPVAGSNSPT